jgi:hypothetical protein
LLAIAVISGALVRAQETAVPADVDKVLWCASAFYWLAGSAEDSGDKTEAEMYDRWSSQLLELAGVSLTASGYAPDSIEALISAYDERVLGEIGSAEAPYDVATCPTLLGAPG